MTSTDKTIWFPAKRYGWGWGLPVAWQGWGVLMLFLIRIVGSGWLLPPHKSPFAYGGCIVGLTVILITVCWVKGEKPRWRWDKDD
ncbi:hypothetical protein BLA50215_05438 [Burkholderia lata]|uniref:hypothetical protein n=1 Tax=Burkholderia lata (strain ATCC 17760 / DSM 23089 / LMG 22485 / NCIMB 9086 / R18194 / 383) TaxID=482957 RepID=UPI0014535E25|nr:hypothetical protein [Burkholderia lata]VWD41747.1 hypothetical protein BLA50215_05438 [Burkholderia lata]